MFEASSEEQYSRIRGLIRSGQCSVIRHDIGSEGRKKNPLQLNENHQWITDQRDEKKMRSLISWFMRAARTDQEIRREQAQ